MKIKAQIDRFIGKDNRIKAYALLLAGVILTSLAGCGNIEQNTEKEISPPVQTIQTADITSATETSDDITVEESALPAVKPETPVVSEPTPAQSAEEKTPEAPPTENPRASFFIRTGAVSLPLHFFADI